MALRSTSDTTTVTVPAGAWTGAPAGDWLVVRIDPAPASGVSGGFQPASEILDVTAYWALNGSPVTSFSLPLEIEVDNATAHVIPAVFESGAWRPIALMSGSGLPASWADGFELDGTNVRILTRHLSLFTLLEDVQAPAKPGNFKGTVSGKSFSLSWSAAADNSGLISAYRIYANNALVKTVDGSQRSVGMGKFKLTDKRSFQVAAVDAAGNVGPKSGALKVVPKVAKLTLAAAKSALKKRGFKVGKVTYRTSSVPKGKVIKGGVSGLRPAGSKVGAERLQGQGRLLPPGHDDASAVTPRRRPPRPRAPRRLPPRRRRRRRPAPTVTPSAPPATTAEESHRAEARPRPPLRRPADHRPVRPAPGARLRPPRGRLLDRGRRRPPRPAAPPHRSRRAIRDQLLLWDQRILQSIRSFLRHSVASATTAVTAMTTATAIRAIPIRRLSVRSSIRPSSARRATPRGPRPATPAASTGQSTSPRTRWPAKPAAPRKKPTTRFVPTAACGDRPTLRMQRGHAQRSQDQADRAAEQPDQPAGDRGREPRPVRLRRRAELEEEVEAAPERARRR